MEIISAATLLFLVMDPLGNIPIFLSVLEGFSVYFAEFTELRM